MPGEAPFSSSVRAEAVLSVFDQNTVLRQCGIEPEGIADVPLSYNGDWAKADFSKYIKEFPVYGDSRHSNASGHDYQAQ
jgi:hypothetical protein